MAMYRRLPVLAATSAAVALTLSGCGLFGGNDESSNDEASQEQTTSSASADSADQPTDGGSESATGGATSEATDTDGAPTDLSNGKAMGALNGETVGGVTLNALPAAMMKDQGMDIGKLLEDEIGTIAVDPTKCSEPVRGSFMGGVVQSNMSDGVVGVDSGGSVIVTVHSFDSEDEAKADLESFEKGVDDCSDSVMSVDGASIPVAISHEEITVEGTQKAIETELNARAEEVNVHTGRMVYGNSVVTVVDSSEYQGQRGDYEELLTEIADLLKDA